MNWGQLVDFLSRVNWGQLGDFLTGISTAIIALYAGVLSRRLAIQQNRKQWVDDFRSLYAEFWSDNDISEVRRWIFSKQLYNNILKPVLVRRNQQMENDLDEQDSIKMDKVDKFISIMVRLQVAEKIGMPKRERDLARLLFSEYWIKQVNKRLELREYAKINWEGELDLDKD